MQTKIPIACNLPNDELNKRTKTAFVDLKHSLFDSKELENGFSFKFSAEDSIFEKLINFISFERKCCPFLNFKLVAIAGRETISLELTGEKGTKELLTSLFGWQK